MDELNTNQQPQTPAVQPAPSQPEAKQSFLAGNKGLIIAVAIAIIVAVIGASALIGLNSSNEYQGMIQRLDDHTKQNKN